MGKEINAGEMHIYLNTIASSGIRIYGMGAMGATLEQRQEQSAVPSGAVLFHSL